MADEARIQSSLQITKRSEDGAIVFIDHQTRPAAFTADVTGSSGPYGGTRTVTETGEAVDLTDVGTPGLCRIMNQSESYYLMVGVHDGTSFFPLLELLPGESFCFRLHRFLGVEYVGTGTPADANSLWLQSVGGGVPALIEVFPV